MDITELRSKINEIDSQLLPLFIERMKTSSRIAEYKMANNIPVLDEKREQEILRSIAAGSGKLYGPYARALYAEIFELSRRLQSVLMQVNSIEYGLIGEDVSYSYSKWIHHAFGNRSFGLYSLPEEILPILFEKRYFKGLTIASDYKALVVKYCDRLDPIAKRCGYVNTIVKEADGTLTGYNTEYDAVLITAELANVDFWDKKVMILGNGSYATSAALAARDNGAAEIIHVTRTGKLNFSNYRQRSDADIIINGTPMGMTPETSTAPVDISAFNKLSGVFDAVYTPVTTKLIADARKKGIRCEDGLTALIAKASKTSSLFGFEADSDICNDLYDELTSFIE